MNRIIKMMILADATWYFGEGMLGPLFAIFTERIGGNILDVSWAWSIYLIVSGILIILVGKISDKIIGHEKLLFIGYALNALLTFGYLAVDNMWQLSLIQVGLGIATALATPTWDAIYSKNQDTKIAGLEWGLADGSSELLSGIAILIGGFLVAYFSFNVLFLTMGFIQLLAVLFISLVFWRQRQ